MAAAWLEYLDMATMHLKAVDVIKKPPDQRSNVEVELIAPWLRKQTHLLQGLEKEALVQIVKNCDYMRANKDQILIRQGDKGDCLFIILVGHVSVYVSNAAIVLPADSSLSPETSTAATPLGRSATNQSGYSLKSNKSDVRLKRLDRSKFGKMVLKFDEGKCFGEVALISDDSRRNATIITDVTTDLLVIRKDLYDSTLKEHQEKEFEEKRVFARKHPLFKNWDKRLHRTLEMSLVKEVYTFGAQMVKQGDPFTGLIFFLKGRARVLVEPSRHNMQYEDHFPFATKNDIYAIEFNRPQKKRPEHPEEILRWEHIEIRRTEGYAAAEKRRFHREIPLCLVEEGEILGDIECICNLNTHTVSVVCMAPTEVFTLSMKNLERLTKKVPRTMDALKLEVETKLKNRLQSQQGSEVFLYRHLLFKLTEEIQQTGRKSPDFGVGAMSKRLPEKEVLFQHLMTSFMENKAEAVIPHVEGSVFLREKMREKARLRDMVKENKKSNEGQRKYRKTTVRRPPSAKPRSIKHLKLALKKQEDSTQLTEREYLAREYRTLETRVMKEFYVNSLASLSSAGDEQQGMRVLTDRLKEAGDRLGALPRMPPIGRTDLKQDADVFMAEDGLPMEASLTRQKTFITELNLSEPDLSRALDREPTERDLMRPRGTKSAEPTDTVDEQNDAPTTNVQGSSQNGLTDAPTFDIQEGEEDGHDNNQPESVKDTHTQFDESAVFPGPKETGSNPAQHPPQTATPRSQTPPLNAATEAIVAREAVQLEGPFQFQTGNDAAKDVAAMETESPTLMTSQSFKELQQVRSLICNKVELASDDPQYRDWETSDTSLEYLEHRIKNFKINREPTFVRLPNLTRFQAGDEKRVHPKPGGRVVIQRKRCNADNADKCVTNHVHIRRHVISRVPDYSKLRHHKMLSHFVLDDLRAKWMDGGNNETPTKFDYKRRGSTNEQKLLKSSEAINKDTGRYIPRIRTLPSISSSK